MANSVDISVEPLQECQIQEILYDGQEIYTQPLSMSVNFTRLTHKIDFSKDESESKGGKPTSESDKTVEEEPTQEGATASLNQWPWESVRNKLRSALTEINVLTDVLQLVKTKNYMILDPVNQDPPERNNNFTLYAKKKALQGAAELLRSGSERVRQPQEIPGRQTLREFHHDLFTLRQSWRLKKQGNTILGDLSYKSAGSTFWQNGMFEVHKNEPDDTVVDLTDSPNISRLKPKSALSVTVPRELQGTAFIYVSIRNMPETTDLTSLEVNQAQYLAAPAIAELTFLQKLENAQNVIFCKEVFAELAKQATQSKTKIPHLIMGNQIFIYLFPGIQLHIALCHSIDKKLPVQPHQPKPDPVLEHSLHQLLHSMHHRRATVELPHPVTSLAGVSKRRRVAGPQGYTREEMTDPPSGTMLEQVIQQARHMVVRQRVLSTLDNIAMESRDPAIITHLSPLGQTTESLMHVTITSVGFENIRTSFSLHLVVDELCACTKDGRSIHMKATEEDLKTFLASQIASHHFATAQSMAQWLGWKTLSCNSRSGSGAIEPNGLAQTLLLESPNGTRLLQFKFGPQSGVVLKQKTLSEAVNLDSKEIFSNKWAVLRTPFQPISIAKIPGRSFAKKLETLMACLSILIPTDNVEQVVNS